MNTKLREDVNEEDKWNLELIYENIDSYNKDYEKLEKMLPVLEEDCNNLLESSKDFAKYYEDVSEFLRLIDNLNLKRYLKLLKHSFHILMIMQILFIIIKMDKFYYDLLAKNRLQ
jgi:oligoendopeptidase F